MHDDLLSTTASRVGRETEVAAPPRPPVRRCVPRPMPAGVWADTTLASCFLVVTVLLLFRGPTTDLDLWVRSWCAAHQLPTLQVLAQHAMHLSEEIPILITALTLSFHLSWRHQTVRPIFPVGGAAVLSAILVVGLKRLTDRTAPFEPGPVEVFAVPGGESYPSGHMVNAVVWYGVLAALLVPYLPRVARGLLRGLPPVLAFVATVYLGYHWISDDVAGLILGILVHRAVCRIPWSHIPLPCWLERRPQAADRPWP